MTILHVIEPFASGVTTFLVHLTHALPSHRHVIVHGVRTTVDTIEKVKARFDPDVSFIKWPHAQREISAGRDLRAFFALLKILRSTPADVIHLHSSKAGFIGRVACFFLRKKCVVYTPHAAPFLRRDVSYRTQKFYVALEKLGYKLGGTVVSCCSSEQQAYKSIGIETACISNGVPLVNKSIDKSARVNVVTLGLITRQKNPALFNRVAEHFRGTALPFTWVGDGDLRDTLSAHNITVTGWVGDKVAGRYLHDASIYLSTSAWEGLPYAVLEAMQAGCCLVLSNTGGHRDVVQHGINGFLFNTAEEAVAILEQLCAYPDRIKEVSAAAQKRVADFLAERMAIHYETIYNNLST